MEQRDDDGMLIFGTFRLLMKVLAPVATEVGASLNITPIHHQTLFYICHNKDCKMTDIAREFSISPAAVTRIVNNLIEPGLVERFNDESDRRVIRLRMTKKGLRTMTRGKEAAEATLQGVIQRMSDEDAKALFRGMSALNRALREQVGTDPGQAAGS